ncbi:MAG: helix-turn-helix domain-containing protein [Lachnospiraceae bacterium]|nr:helix-turn-helix domain-containing protein [Lachnospiraceae bacterium]
MEYQLEEQAGSRTVAMGGKIYSLRMAKGMTQEQLAGVLCISPAAVSKWERNLANPNIEMLWALADFFDCSIDELVGRRTKELEHAGEYDRIRLRMAETAEELLVLSEVSRQKGLLAMEEELKRYQGESSFLKFAVGYFLNAMMENIIPDQIVGMLNNYAATLPPFEQAEGRMITEVLGRIVSGERKELIAELAASYIGVGYREKIGGSRILLNREMKREELIAKYGGRVVASGRTALLEELAGVGNFEIQVLLRNLDNATLTAALCGASGAVVTKFLENLADRVLVFICEDMDNFKGGEEEMAAAQGRVLELFRNIQV